MTTTRQPKGIPSGGQFAPESRSEAHIVLHDADLREMESAAKRHRRLQQDRIDQLNHELAVASAAAIAARTKAMFRSARYAVFHTGDDDYTAPQPYSVLDAERNELSVRWSHREGPSKWVFGEADDDPESVHVLACDLEYHGGRLDGILTERLPGPGQHRHLVLDIDKALETS